MAGAFPTRASSSPRACPETSRVEGSGRLYLGASFAGPSHIIRPARASASTAAQGGERSRQRRRHIPMETHSPKPPQPSMLKLLLWTFLWLVMWFWAILGPFFVVLAVVSFFVDISPFADMTLFGGEPVRTPQQKAVFLAVGALIGLVGI